MFEFIGDSIGGVLGNLSTHEGRLMALAAMSLFIVVIFAGSYVLRGMPKRGALLGVAALGLLALMLSVNTVNDYFQSLIVIVGLVAIPVLVIMLAVNAIASKRRSKSAGKRISSDRE